KSLNARESGRWERLLPRPSTASSLVWSTGVVSLMRSSLPPAARRVDGAPQVEARSPAGELVERPGEGVVERRGCLGVDVVPGVGHHDERAAGGGGQMSGLLETHAVTGAVDEPDGRPD